MILMFLLWVHFIHLFYVFPFTFTQVHHLQMVTRHIINEQIKIATYFAYAPKSFFVLLTFCIGLSAHRVPQNRE